MNRFANSLLAGCSSLIIATLSACGGGIKSLEADSISEHISTTIQSTQTDYVYPIYIYLPPSYASGTSSYPVIYVTDGDTSFPPDGRFINFEKILRRRHIDAILIGIGGSERRDRDYNLPGAIAYHQFLTWQVIPFVESHFRADPARRMLTGISYGGSFVVTSLFLEAPSGLFFSHYISAEGSFFLPAFIEQERTFVATIGTRGIPTTLILARGAPSNKISQQQFSSAMGSKNLPAVANLSRGFNEGTNSREVDAFYKRMEARHYAGLLLIETSFPTDHIGTDNPSFDDAMARIFN